MRIHVGAVESSKGSMEWVLTQQGKGNAVVLVVGGVMEALEARPGSTTLVLARRKGFVRIALEYGYAWQQVVVTCQTVILSLHHV